MHKTQYEKHYSRDLFDGLQSPQKNVFLPKKFLNEPVFRNLCIPHLKQLIVLMLLESPNGEPISLVLYRRPSVAIFVN